jgi:PAS domain S-box-containing protein
VSNTLPNLEDLRHAPEAAWLWDAARGRLVWANAPAIEAFGGQSIFDLVDRPFDVAEPGIVKLASLVGKLSRTTPEEVELSFPSLGKAEKFKCRCCIHALSDGRDGILAILKVEAAAIAPISHLLDDMPVATIALNEAGDFIQANSLAQQLYDSSKIKSLTQLLKPEQQATELLERLQSTGLISAIANFESPYGLREARLTLRRAKQAAAIFATLVLEDITERRLLEKQFAAAPALATSDKQTFEALGRTLTQATAPIAKLEKPATEILPPEISFSQLPAVPAALHLALDKNPTAFVIKQNAQIVFVSETLAKLCRYASAAKATSVKEFLASLQELNPQAKNISVPDVLGHIQTFKVSCSDLPWLNGKAQHYTFEKRVEFVSPIETEIGPSPAVVPILEKPFVVVARPAENLLPENAPAPAEKSEREPDPRSILDIASDGIITLDKAGKILSFSAGAEAIFGYRNAEVLHKPLAELLNADSAKVLESYLASLDLIGLASVFNDGREVQAIVKQGGNVPLFLNIGRLDEQNSKAVYCAVLRDLTNWKRTEKELRLAKDQAEESSKHKSDFLARVSHELRTPLNAILGFSDIMRLGQFGEIKNDRYRAYVNDIHASGSHLLAMINDLLDLSKIESGRMELDFTAVNLNDSFDHASKLLQDQAIRARVLMRKSFPDNLPRVVADQRSLRQIMINLLSNAIKYTDAGGQVIVSATTNKSGGLALRLKDTGIGMKAEELAQALLPFSRVDTPGRERQGTGLGLPLTKALVEANRASFAMSSEPGQGTLIEITFPTTRVLAE